MNPDERASAALQLGRPGDAEKIARQALATHPESRSARMTLAYALAAQSKFDEAIPIAEQLVGELPDLVELHTLLGGLHLERGRGRDFAAAEHCFAEALRLDPENTVALSTTGEMWLRRGQPKRAMPFLQRALAQDPGKSDTYNQLARAYVAQNRKREAEVMARLAVSQSPEESAGHTMRAVTAYANSRYDEAVDACREALRIDAENTAALELLPDAARRSSTVYGLLIGPADAFNAIPVALRWLMLIAAVLTGFIGLFLVYFILVWCVRSATDRRLARDPAIAQAQRLEGLHR
ncbi:MAG: tetratricopeptide repeat protein [Planctomycetota bacterium]